MLVKEIGSTQIAPSTPDFKSMSLKFQYQYLFLYQTRKIGYGEQLVFHFYYMQNPLNFIPTKRVDVNFIFSPDPDNMRVFHMRNNMKYTTSNKDPKLKDGFAIPVLRLRRHRDAAGCRNAQGHRFHLQRKHPDRAGQPGFALPAKPRDGAAAPDRLPATGAPRRN